MVKRLVGRLQCTAVLDPASVIRPRAALVAGLALAVASLAVRAADPVPATASASAVDGTHEAPQAVRVEAIGLMDDSRRRAVPLTLYWPEYPARRLRLAVLSHGHGARNTDYAFIARFLATHGYLVASVQHELPGDDPLPSGGDPVQTRMVSWQRGARNVLFVIEELKVSWPTVDATRVLLVGHSHGGDTSMVLAREHPARFSAVISLDNRRMPWPRAAQPRIFSLRSRDQRADDGVVPSAQEQARYGMQSVTLSTTDHDDMWDGATGVQKAEMLGHLGRFLESLP